MAATIAFFGNRYAPLSEVFYEGLREQTKKLGVDLVVVDTSTAAETSLRRRLRNHVIAAGKRIVGVRHPTASVDWLPAAQAAGSTIVTPRGHSLRDPALPETLRDLRVSAALVAGCDQILRQPLIAAIPRVVNYHNSLLPRYRGCDAVQWAMLAGESSIGFSFHTIESERVDAGRLLLQDSVGLDDEITPMELDLALARAAARRLGELLDLMLGESWRRAWPTVVGGDYHKRHAIRAFQVFDPRLSPAELRRRLRIFGWLALPYPSRLRITSLALLTDAAPDRQDLEIGAWKVRGPGIAVGCTGGAILIGSIHYLPASLFALRMRKALLPGGEPCERPGTASGHAT